MKKAAVVIDSWKLQIFKKVLDDAGFSYAEHNGPTKDTLLLQVTTVSIEALKPVIENANSKCAKSNIVKH